jgi:MiaB/RimO family radical SAM methylthiotransferase
MRTYTGPTFGEAEIDTLDKLIRADVPISEIASNNLIPPFRYFEKRELLKTIAVLPLRLVEWYHDKLGGEVNAYRPEDHSAYYIKIATGCLRHCSFCAVCHSRGRLRSKSIEKILEEFKEGLNQGFTTFGLLGTDLGNYGKDVGHNLCDLLKEMVKEDGEYQIGLRNVYPGGLIEILDDLKSVLITGKIWYIEIPVESGSNRILELMKRGYTVEKVKECVLGVRQAWPDIRIRTQLMVGFPTETKQDFAASIQLLDEMDFDFVEVYQFSPRPNTSAEQLKGQISDIIAKYRMYRILVKELLRLSLRDRRPCGRR